MASNTKCFFSVFGLWTLVGALFKLPFLACYLPLGGEITVGDWMEILWHGLRLDVSIAGYLSILPGLMLIVSVWYRGNVLRWVWNGYFIITSFVCSLAYISNIGLYHYWRFPLDNTPLLYLTTSPKDAFASMTAWQMLCASLAIAVATAAMSYIYNKVWRLFSGPTTNSNAVKASTNATKADTNAAKANANAAKTEANATKSDMTIRRRCMTSAVLLVLTAALIIPIRGGFSTGTNHTGSVYFSSDIRYNHAAVNPIFSFMEAATHQEDIASKYRFMENDKATELFKTLSYTQLRPDSVRNDYNVILICLEGFSKYLMEESGHVSGIVPNLERYSREGLYFDRFFANTFRTDRAIVAILSGLPAQPTMSVMDNPRISTSLPSIARTLGNNGYSTHFYYGGDVNYSNMNSYIMGTGFRGMTSETDFDDKERTGKWGVPDGTLFNRALTDITRAATDGKHARTDSKPQPFFNVIITGSSHEPFDVPGEKRFDNAALNAFAYADACLGEFVEGLKATPLWTNTLVVIVPDHLGAYPPAIDNYQLWRYEIPLIMTGGAIKEPRTVSTVGAQTDIAATILGLLGVAHDDFIYSKDLLDGASPHFAFFTFPDAMGMVTDSAHVIFDNTSHSVVSRRGSEADSLAIRSQAFLQKLYDDLSAR